MNKTHGYCSAGELFVCIATLRLFKWVGVSRIGLKETLLEFIGMRVHWRRGVCMHSYLETYCVDISRHLVKTLFECVGGGAFICISKEPFVCLSGELFVHVGRAVFKQLVKEVFVWIGEYIYVSFVVLWGI